MFTYKTLLRLRGVSVNFCARGFRSAAKHRTLWSFLDDHDSSSSSSSSDVLTKTNQTGPSVYQYSALLSESEPAELRRIRENAIARDPREAQKMIAPLQGAFMAYMASSQKARRVLELGCYIGYSALWLAHGLRKQKDPAHLWTCEKDTNVAELAKANIQFAGFEDTVTVISQPAAKVLEGWDPQRKLDLVFIDANKSGYRTYYDMILDRELLSDHGQIVVDNVLFHGQVHGLSHAAKDAMAGKSKIAQRMAEFNSHVADDPRTSQVLLPVFDGMLLIQRKA